MKKIELVIKKDLTKLAGNAYGKNIYETQVKSVINLKEKTEIVIPERIDRIASSFIQGFFSEIVAEIGLVGIEEKIEISSSIPRCKQFILENLG